MIFLAKNRTNLFFSGVLILTIANILVKAIGLLYKIPLQNLIGDEGMGYFNAAYRIYTMFYMVSTAGLPVAVSLMISESRAKGNRREVKEIFKAAVILFVIIGTIGTSFMFFGSKILAFVIKMEASYLCMMAISPTLLFICICSAVRGYFQGYQNMLPTAVSEVLEALGKLILGMLLATFAIKQGYGLPVVAAYAILGLTIGVFAGSFYIVMHRTFFKSEEFDAEFVEDENAIVRSKGTIMKTLFKIAIPITISASVMSVADAVDVVVISRQLQSLGFTEEVAAQYYGNYTTLCVPMFNLPPVLIYPISYSIVPYISSALAEKDTKKAKEVMTTSLKIAALIAIPSALGLSAMSKPILSLIFKNEASVEMAAPLLSVLALSVFFLGILSVSNALLQATKNERLPIISMVAGAVVKLLSSYFLIGNKAIGMYGAPIGTFLCYLTITVLNMVFLVKKVGLIPDFKEVFFKPFLASVPAVLSAWLCYQLIAGVHSKLATLAAICVAVVVYFIAVLLFKLIKKEEVLMIPKGNKIYGLLHKLKLM